MNTCNSAEAALASLEREPVDAIVSDIQMPGVSGMELFARVQDAYPEIPVILMTAFGSTEQAVQAVRRGAFHYFEKPIANKLDLFWTAVREAVAKRGMSREIDLYKREKTLSPRRPVNMVGQSEGMEKVLRAAEEVANLPVTVLIIGETGTGKELVAHAIHEMSDRRDKPFFAVNSTEFAEGVLESETVRSRERGLYGRPEPSKGAFRAGGRRDPVLGRNQRGVLLTAMQTLEGPGNEDFHARRRGGCPSIRIFASSPQPIETLAADVASGRFRKDLYYRLNTYVIEVPPLRERREDIPILAEFYLNKFNEAFRRHVTSISGDALEVLHDYDWPGNVRELVNVMERAVITCRNNIITTRHLPFEIECRKPTPMVDLNLRAMERRLVQLAMERTGNNKSRAAETAGDQPQKPLGTSEELRNPPGGTDVTCCIN